MPTRSQSLALLGFLITGALLFGAYAHWNFDDSYIVYRIVDNILQGHGWVYNEGERYNASTSVLNTLLITLTALFTNDIPIAAHVLGSLAIVLCALTTFDLLRMEHGPLLGGAAGLLVAATLAANNTWGLESHLFAGLVLLFIWMEKKRINSWYLLGLIFLTRPDGILFAGMKGLLALLRTRRIPLRGILQFSLIVVPWLLFSLWYFGQLLPETLGNKIWQGNSGFWGRGQVYLRGLNQHNAQLGVLLWPLSALALFGAVRLCKERNPFCYLLLFAATQQLFYVLINVPAYHWYFAMLDLAFLISCIYGLASLLALKRSRIIESCALALACLYFAWPLTDLYETEFRDARDVAYHRLSERIDALGIEPGQLAALEVGTIGYLQDREMIDLVSLTTANPEFLSGANLDDFFALAPQVVVLHQPVWLMEQALYDDPRFAALYERREVVQAAVPTQIFVRKVEGAAALHKAVAAAEQSVRLPSRQFTEFSTSQECTLDMINGRFVARGEAFNWQPDIDSMSFVGWMFDREMQQQETVSDERSDIALTLIDAEGEMTLYKTRTTRRQDVARAFGNPNFAMSGFRQNLRRSRMEPQRYLLGAVQISTNNVCDLQVELIVSP